MVVKYGVVQYQQMMRDLENWKPFFVAGRMQKPILDLMVDASQEKFIKEAIKKNRKAAVRWRLRLDCSNFTAISKSETFWNW